MTAEYPGAYPGQARHAQVVHALGAAIVRGELGPGSPVPTEDELVGRFEVGRSALREGVKVLAGKGLLESRTSAGTRVRPRESWNLLDPDVLRWRYSEDASPADIRALAGLRVALEPGAARLAAESASAAQRGMIAAAMAALWATVGSPDEFIAADLAFHRAVFAGCNNDLLLYIHDVVSVALGAIRPLHTSSVAHNRETLPAHQRVAEAIQRGHHRKAEAAMREIVEGARADLMQGASGDAPGAGSAEPAERGRSRTIMTSDPGRVRMEIRDQVAVLTIDRPAKLNAFTPSMTAALMSHVTHVNEEPEVRAVVLTGTGRAFCAGSDIAGLDDYASPWEFGNRPDYCDTIRMLRPPVIAAVNGYALGGGLELALACDIRLAAEPATFAAPEIKLGWIGGGGMSALLAHSIGPGNAAVMLLTGDPVDSATALRWGLVTEVLPAGDLAARAGELAATIASRAPIAAQTAKKNLRAAFEMPLGRAIDYERQLQTICFATEDAAEGRAAFAGRRPPVFRAR